MLFHHSNAISDMHAKEDDVKQLNDIYTNTLEMERCVSCSADLQKEMEPFSPKLPDWSERNLLKNGWCIVVADTSVLFLPIMNV